MLKKEAADSSNTLLNCQTAGYMAFIQGDRHLDMIRNIPKADCSLLAEKQTFNIPYSDQPRGLMVRVSDY